MKLDHPKVDVVLLDDAYQHRYVKAGLNILLTDFHRLFQTIPYFRQDDYANLKVAKQGAHRDRDKMPGRYQTYRFQYHHEKTKAVSVSATLFFLVPIWSINTALRRKTPNPRITGKDEQVLLVTGIASPVPLVEKLKVHTPHVNLCQFDDHHDFSSKDLQAIKERFERLEGKKKLIITTEKDATRLQHHPALAETLKPYLYILPIEIEFLQNQQHIFNQNIIGYVRAHSRNSSLPER